jgi:hypothetical protein
VKLALNLTQFMGLRAALERTLTAQRLGYHAICFLARFRQLRTPELDHPEAIIWFAGFAAPNRSNCSPAK